MTTVSKDWTVRSYHLNVKSGDSAIHFLQRQLPNGNYVKSIVMIDGGFSSFYDDVLDLLLHLKNISKLKREDGTPATQLDAYIVSHWDRDHWGGLCQVVVRAVAATMQAYQDKYQPLDNEKWKQGVDSHEIYCPLSRYDESNRPISQWYGPNITFLEIIKTKLEGKTYRFATQSDSNTHTATVCVHVTAVLVHSKGEYKLNVYVPFAQISKTEAGLIGVDFFTGVPIISASEAKSPRSISKRLNDKIDNNGAPALVCVGADYNNFCDPEYVSQRDGMFWIQKDQYKQTALSKSDPNGEGGWHRIPFCESDFNDSPISTNVIKKGTTDVNQDSIALMVIWPHHTKAVVSHYFAGDLGYDIEEKILRWSTIPENEGNPTSLRRSNEIDIVKLSHHGRTFPRNLQAYHGLTEL